MSKPSDWHHHRPVHHLRHFTGSDGRLWIYDRAGRFEPRQDIPKNVGAESGLYAPGEGAVDPKDDQFEVWLANEIDGPAGAPLKALANGSAVSTLSDSERSAVAGFIVAQDMRTPRVRDFLMPGFQAGIEAEWPTIARDSLVAMGLQPTHEDVREVAAMFQPKVSKTNWLDFIGRSVNKGAAVVFARNWSLLEAPNSYEWLTNDVGVVKFLGSFGQPVPHSPGWGEGTHHWVFPLSSRYALAIAPDNGVSRAEARSKWLKQINRQIVADAKVAVFSASKADFVLKWLREDNKRRSLSTPAVSTWSRSIDSK